MYRAALRVGTTAALALSMLVAPSVSSSSVAAHPRATDPLQVRVGTYNIISRASLDTFKKAVTAVKPSVDVLGLQEIGMTAKNKWLIGSDRNWGYYRPPALQQNPVIWDRTKFDFVTGKGVRLSKRRKIEKRGGRGLQAASPNWASVVQLFHRASGRQITVVNVHLLSGTIKGGRPVPGRPKAFKIYRKELAKAVKLVKAERSVSDDVFILGDFNSGYEADVKRTHKALPVKRFHRIGYRSMWKGSPLLSKRYGTRGSALLDQIWYPTRPASTQILRKVRGSDHRPAVATYRLPAPEPGYLAPVGSVGFAAAPPVRNEFTRRDGKFVRIPLRGDLSHGYFSVRVVADRSTAEEGADFYIDDSSYLPGSRAIYVKINKDNKVEPEEHYTLELVDSVNMTVIPGSGVVTGVIEANKS